MSANLASMRKPYNGKANLLRDDVIKNECPYRLFKKWFDEAKENAPSYNEANGVCLATATKDGHPSVRMVLLKGFELSSGKFTIFTNYQSRKGREIAENPNVAMLFYWDFMQRQVRIEGRASKSSTELSEEYFHQRPPGTRISARVSQQSQPVQSRKVLEKLSREETRKWAESDEHLNYVFIPRPESWGGYVIEPIRFEFWQGQSDRLHDRFQFDKITNTSETTTTTTTWTVQRLQP